ncbi:MAG: sugar phosphate isomerase/epimerase [Archaeoglobaceae archaeon]
MKLLFSSMFLYEYSTEFIAKAAELAGYDGVEFWVETPHFWVDRNPEKLEQFAGMTLAIHAPVLDLNPVSVNRSLCDLTLKENLSAISIASKSGAELVTVHAGKRSAARPPVWADYWMLRRFLRILSRYARIKGVSVAIENSEPRINALCKRAEELAEFANSYDLYVTLDVKHALLAGGVENFVDLLFERIKNVHVSYYDSKNHHVEPSRSEEVGEVLRTLSELGYDGLITVELDDLGIGNVGFFDKVKILKKEANYVRSFF